MDGYDEKPVVVILVQEKVIMSSSLNNMVDMCLLMMCIIFGIYFYPTGLILFALYVIYWIFIPRYVDDIVGNLYRIPSRFSEFIHRNDPEPEPETEEEKEVMRIFNELKEKGAIDKDRQLRFVK